MGGCAKNSDKKDGKDGAKDSKDGNYSIASGFGLHAKPSGNYFISKEKNLYYVNLQRSSASLNDSLLSCHLQYIESLTSSGNMKSCGAFNDGKGGYQVIIASSEEEANRLVYNDPLVQNNYYVISEIKQLTEWNLPKLDHENLFEEDMQLRGPK